MPHSPSDDPFADLFGKLPDPRSRAIRSSGEDAAPGASADHAPVTGAEPPPANAPLSRRAAREAAARSSTGPAPQTPAGTAPEAAATDHRAAADPDLSRHSPVSAAAVAGAAAVPAAAASPAGARGADEPPAPPAPPAPPMPSAAAAAASVEDSWVFAPTSGTVTASYSRSGAAAAVVDAPAPPRQGPTTTLDELFSDSHVTVGADSPPAAPSRRRRRIGGWIAFAVVLAIFGAIAGGAWYVWSTYENQIRAVMGWEEPKDFESGLANGEVLFTIVSGDTGQPISQRLYDSGVTKTPEAFYDYLIDNGENPVFHPGVYAMQKQMTSEAALAALMNPANKLENTAQLREGLTVAQSVERLAEGTGIPLADLQAAVADPAAYGVNAGSLEGWLFPATYTFDPGVTAQGVVQTLVDRTVQSLDTAGVPADDRQRVLTIASIIQREARFQDDFYKVSRVIQNRLDQGMKLQMDSTAQYGFGEIHAGSASTSSEAQFDDNPWNTYVIDGLPVGPIANPGDLAIDAAMKPAEGPWLFFVTVNLDSGETLFTTNADEHQRAVNQWIEWCRDHPDSGC